MDKQADALKLVKRCVTEAINARVEQTSIPSPFYSGGDISDPWTLYQELYRGDHWSRMGALPSWKTRPVDELAFGIVERMTTALTDNRPKCEFLPNENGDTDKARIVQAGFDYWWNLSRASATDTLAVKDSRKFGLGWLILRWDAAKKRQVLEVANPEQVYVDPDASADGYDPAYTVYEYMAQVGDILDTYTTDAYGADFGIEDLGANWLSESGLTTFNRVMAFFGTQTSVRNPAKSVPVYELWIRDPETVVWTEDFDDGLSVKKRKLKYRGGRLLKVCGRVVLEDKANPYEHGEFPFTPVFAYPESGRFYPRGDIELVLNSQLLINRYNQILFDATVKSGGGIVLTNPLAGVDKSQITNDVVQVINCKDVNAALRVEQFPAPSRHIVDHLMTLRSNAQDAVGWHDISQGRFTPGNKTAQEIGALVESDQTRVRMAAKWHSWALERIGRQWLSNARQFGDFKWIVRVTDDDGSQSSEVFTPKTLKGLELDLTVGDFAQLPDSLQERKQLALQVFQMGLIDPEEVLKTLDWPNYKQVVARMTAKAEADAAAQAGAVAQSPSGIATEPASGAPDPAMMEMMLQQRQMPPIPPEAMPPDMGGPPMQEPDIPDTADPMAVFQQIADANGIPVGQLIEMFAMQGDVA